eukprot:3841655-Rhodomonas_salina.1
MSKEDRDIVQCTQLAAYAYLHAGAGTDVSTTAAGDFVLESSEHKETFRIAKLKPADARKLFQ